MEKAESLRTPDLAKHNVQMKSGHFDPEKFEDHYESALTRYWPRSKQARR